MLKFSQPAITPKWQSQLLLFMKEPGIMPGWKIWDVGKWICLNMSTDIIIYTNEITSLLVHTNTQKYICISSHFFVYIHYDS